MLTGFSLLLWLGALLCFFAYIVEVTQQPLTASRDNVSKQEFLCF